MKSRVLVSGKLHHWLPCCIALFVWASLLHFIIGGCGVDTVFMSLFGYGICIIEASEVRYVHDSLS